MSHSQIQSTTLAETQLCLVQNRRSGARSPQRVWRSVIALVAGISIALGSVAPTFARGRNDDVAKAIAAAIVLGLIVKGLDKKRDRPRAEPEPVRRPRVPTACAIELDGAQRSVTVYPESCLKAEGFDYPLPRDCAKTARIYGRPDRVYGVQCLRSAGFRVAGY
ncbi:MAG: hypothetical protein V4516_00160 [Pseudomonadota bacterium]